MVYEAALRSDRYEADVYSQDVEEVPGRRLADAVAAQLRSQGFYCTVVDESPIWVVNCRRDNAECEVLVSLYEPGKEPRTAVWNVSVPSSRSFFDRLLKRPEPDVRIELVLAVHSALEAIEGVSDIRWFRKWPAEPYACPAYSKTPEVK